MTISSNDVAREVLDVVPLVMRTIRSEMRSRRNSTLSVAQFRTMNYINRNSGAALQDVAGHLGLTPPTVSKMIDGLVVDHFVERQASSQDRRKVLLGLTSKGKRMLEQARNGAQSRLSEMFSGLSQPECEIIMQGMKCLQTIFSGNEPQQMHEVR
jgi:DNA-binding MarR family transcriptional regulator